MWAENAVFYQIAPVGLCDAPRENPLPPDESPDSHTVNRIAKLRDWIPHLQKLNVNALYLTPVFMSDSHGYNTRDFRRIDNRLGTNANFREFVDACHDADIRVVVDAVFHHVGRNFWAFRDVRERKWDSPYRDWFLINFDGNSAYNDGFWYEGWEGHYSLVKLNLRNPAVVDYLMDCVRFWAKEFDIDGLRLDVAYSLEKDFLRRLRHVARQIAPEFFLLGETLHGDYNQWVNADMLHSCTNYECYKGLYSSFNSMNLFEIVHSLKRQFGPEYWTLYKGKHLLAFVDNHDVGRIASVLQNPKHLPLIYGLMFGMPGIPCLYYGSEWGVTAAKQRGSDDNLRPAFDAPEWNKLTDHIARCAKAHRESDALCQGDFQDVVLTNRQTVFRRQTARETVYVAVNADDHSYFARFSAGAKRATDLLTGEIRPLLHDGCELPPYSVAYLKV
ncbi:MAG: maltodextrin glucosidase [Oscillospiraceae bacterium]|nr:maltodextrin glucosidase [Oscillospiraceae bacterium]